MVFLLYSFFIVTCLKFLKDYCLYYFRKMKDNNSCPSCTFFALDEKVLIIKESNFFYTRVVKFHEYSN